MAAVSDIAGQALARKRNVIALGSDMHSELRDVEQRLTSRARGMSALAVAILAAAERLAA